MKTGETDTGELPVTQPSPEKKQQQARHTEDQRRKSEMLAHTTFNT